MRTITAKYNSICPVCKDEIQRGSEISYDAEAKKAYHPICVIAHIEEPAVEEAEKLAIRLGYRSPHVD